MNEMAKSSAPVKDPRAIARKYQLDLCRRAVEENIIVHLGTGRGKTHVAVLLMYELAHTFRKPSMDICVFLAPTCPLVRQQAGYIQKMTDFKVRFYYGYTNRSSHDSWSKEMDQTEVLVMTPQILIDKLRHCFIRMDQISLLIFDECHHAQLDKRHPYAQIMKEFYKIGTGRQPRIFGMTASPITGKGGSDKLNYARCVNSLETLLDAKVFSLDGSIELESVIPSPHMKIYFYWPVGLHSLRFYRRYCEKLEEIKLICTSMAREKAADLKELKRKIKLLSRVHDNLLFCLEQIGFCGAVLACRALLSIEDFNILVTDADNSKDNCLALLYLNRAISTFNCDPLIDYMVPCGNSYSFEALEEPFFSNKLSLLIQILSEHRGRTNVKCIVFVKRIIIARSLACILGNLKALDFWKCQFLVGCRSKSVTRKETNVIVDNFCSGEVNLLVATSVAEEGLDIRTCCLVVRFDLPETVASYIQSRGRARMQQSEYILLLERGNEQQKKLVDSLMFGETVMTEEISCRSTDKIFANTKETTYRVETGACISTGCSVSLLHHYCSTLTRDEYFTPVPKFFFKEDLGGTICCIFLPPNCPVRQVEGPSLSSKQDAKRAACLKACMELHFLGALTEYLLPTSKTEKVESREVHYESDSEEGVYLTVGKGFHEKASLTFLRAPQADVEYHCTFHFYYISVQPIPGDRKYKEFGLFVTDPLPKEAESIGVDLCLAHRRIVKTGLVYSGSMTFDEKMVKFFFSLNLNPLISVSNVFVQILSAQKFQEMFHMILFDRSKFFSEFVSLGEVDIRKNGSSAYYLFLPVIQDKYIDKISIDWTTVECCLSSPVFRSTVAHGRDDGMSSLEMLNLANAPIERQNVIGSLVFTPHSKKFFLVDDILYELNAHNQMKGSKSLTYAEHYVNKFKINLSQPTQPFLKAKELFQAKNLLHRSAYNCKEVREKEEHFIELPPELCFLKIKGFSKEMGSLLSLLPSFMHRLENLLLAAQLKDVFSSSFPEGAEVSASYIMEALTTEKCMEGFSLERLEVLGDAFLKYAVGRHVFLLYDAVDEGQLSTKRSNAVNNSHLCKLAVRKKLQVYINNELFDPSHVFLLGPYSDMASKEFDDCRVEGRRLYRCLPEKTVADVVEALIGAFLVSSGFRAASAFLQWIGLRVDFDVLSINKFCKESYKNLSLGSNIDCSAIEKLLGYTFQHKGLLIQAFIHPSYSKHLGGCYQRLEFLGDAVLEYLIISYYFSSYPDLRPGQLSDLKSMTVNNISLAYITVTLSLHKYLIQDSPYLMEAIKSFEKSFNSSEFDKDLVNERACPKLLGDLLESCTGAVLLDSGFDLNCLWEVMMKLLHPLLCSSPVQVNPLRELRELCQSHHLELTFPNSETVEGKYMVKVIVTTEDRTLTCTAMDHNSRVARITASRKALSKLKALGFNGKSTPLEEVMRSTRKHTPELIGFDETPVVTRFTEETVNSLSVSSSSSSLPDLMHEVSIMDGVAVGKDEKEDEEKEEHDPSTRATLCKKTPTMRLFEACAANYWRRPIFSPHKEKGESHQKKFAYKVSVEVDVANGTVIESVGDLKPKKQAAKDHAAEGALWCLTKMGLLT